MTTPRLSVITDWRANEEDLPDIPPGGEYERVIRPQKFIVLHRVVVRGPVLIRLGIGALPDVPFELDRIEGKVHRYRLKGLDDEALKKNLVRVGAAAVGGEAIAIIPLLEIRLHLRNEEDTPVKPRAALLVQEELP